MKTILEVENLHKKYIISKDNHQTVLNSVNLKIKEGEFVSVMGPSGSGKSTLLYNVSGMDRMTSGSVIFNNQELSAFSEKNLSKLRLNNMGFIFQQIYLLKNLSIFDNIILSAYLAKNHSRKKIKKRALELMERTGISELAENDITQASGGQLQRVAICRALINNPEIVFADEPTGALNSKAAGEIMDILIDINKLGATILLVTHNAKIASRAERVIYMIDGDIVAEKSLKEFDNNFKIREERLSEWLRKLKF